MRLILHIGTEKTGTTTLQHFIYQNRKVLEGYGIGQLSCLDEPAARKLAAFCSPPDMFDDYFLDRQITTINAKKNHFETFQEEFKQEVERLPSHIKTVFVSSEHLHSRLIDLESVKKVRDFFSPYFNDIKVLCYFREQSQMANSLYSTGLKCGYQGRFASHLLACVPDNYFYNFFVFFKWWEEIFGKENLIPRLYDKSRWFKSDIRKDILNLMDKNIEGSDFDFTIDNLNPRLNQIGLALARINNFVNPIYNPDGSTNLARVKFMLAIEKYFSAPKGDVDFAEAESIYDKFNESNTLFAQHFLGLDKNPFPRPRSRRRSGVSLLLSFQGSGHTG